MKTWNSGSGCSRPQQRFPTSSAGIKGGLHTRLVYFFAGIVIIVAKFISPEEKAHFTPFCVSTPDPGLGLTLLLDCSSGSLSYFKVWSLVGTLWEIGDGVGRRSSLAVKIEK